MINEKLLVVLLAGFSLIPVLALSLPMLLKTTLFFMILLTIIGYLNSRELIIEVGFFTSYILILLYAAYDATLLLLAVLTATYLLVIRDALHILRMGKVAGAWYIVGWYLPIYATSLAIIFTYYNFRFAIPRMSATLLVLSALLILLIIALFLNLSRENTSQSH
ncbi:MAG: hypothetical protein ABWK01_08560 [Infirmifilum sp.]